MAAITWRNVEAPDATGAAQILQMAGQNISKGVGAAKDIADNRVAAITDQNVSSLAQQIMSTGEGIEGLQNIQSVENNLNNINAADIGGTKGLQSLIGMTKARRSELELQATDSFNDLVAQAETSGNWSAVKEAEGLYSSLVSNSAPVIQNARNIGINQDANSLMQQLNTGEIKAEDIIDNKNGIYSDHMMNPAFNKVFEAAASKTQNAKLGQTLRALPNYIQDVRTGGKNPNTVLKELYGNYNDDELARNAGALSAISNQIQDAYQKSLNLTPAETMLIESEKTILDGADKIFEQENEVIKNRIAREVGNDITAVTAYDQYKDKNLRMSDVVRSRLGNSADMNDIEQALERLADQDNLSFSAAALAYALDTHPELGNDILTNKAGFRAKLEKAEQQINKVAAAYNKLDSFLLKRNRDFLNYKRDSTGKLLNIQNQLIKSRRSGDTQPNYEGVSLFGGYSEGNLAEELEAILRTGKTVAPKKVSSDAATITRGNPEFPTGLRNVPGGSELNRIFTPRT